MRLVEKVIPCHKYNIIVESEVCQECDKVKVFVSKIKTKTNSTKEFKTISCCTCKI